MCACNIESHGTPAWHIHQSMCHARCTWLAAVLPLPTADIQASDSLLLGLEPHKNWRIHIDVSHSRQPLVKGERLVRYEVNTVMHRSWARHWIIVETFFVFATNGQANTKSHKICTQARWCKYAVMQPTLSTCAGSFENSCRNHKHVQCWKHAAICFINVDCKSCSLVDAQKQTTSREILLWMTPSEAPKALQASECSELLDPARASCWISAQR